jgi:hypothetical protein
MPRRRGRRRGECEALVFDQLGKMGRAMRIRRLAAVAGLATVLATGVLVDAPMASASGAACNPGCTAYAEFDSYGEHFTIHDYSADGHPVVGELDTYESGIGWVIDSYLIDRNGYAGAPRSENLSIAEGTKVRYRACLYKDTSPWDYSCSSWRSDTA